uniref:F-box domain-containing protein n=1 Tax=Ananas comosus var. bracteatus TaxID=296719 RepID=A0A6V7QWK7_ANACO
MEGEPAAKRRRLNNIEKEEEEEEDEKAAKKADCISGLPDHLLHEILACLPTSIAVRTSLLSRRWRTLWTTSPDLSFTTRLPPPSSTPSSASATPPSPSAPSPSPPPEAETRSHGRISAFCFFRLPEAVFRLQHLSVLELCLPRVIPHFIWPPTAFLPSLQRLDLADLNLSLVSRDAISNSCPALKYWRMSLYRAPPELDVSCPLLEVFELTMSLGTAGCVSICGSSVREVRVRQELARAAQAYLKLSAPALRTLEWVGPLPCAAAIADPLPPNLLTSSVVMRPGALNAYTDVNDVLLKADLSVLRVNQLVSSEPRITEFQNFRKYFKAKGGFGPGGYWDSHNIHLEKLVHVSVHDFSGDRYEYDFLKFLLRAATSLREITISADCQASSAVIVRKAKQLQQSFPHIEILPFL